MNFGQRNQQFGGGANNNQQGGGGGGGDGLKQAYVGKPTRPMTIRQLYTAGHVGDGSALVVDGHECGQVIIQGRVVHSVANNGAMQQGAEGGGGAASARNHAYLVTDGTGSIQIRDWVSEEVTDDMLQMAGSFVVAVGTVKFHNGTPFLSGHVTGQSDNNEYIYHFLQAIAVHLRLQNSNRHLEPPQMGGIGPNNRPGQPAMMGQQQQGGAVNHFAGINNGGGAPAAVAGPAPNAAQVELACYKTVMKMHGSFTTMDIFSAVRTQLPGLTVDILQPALVRMVADGTIAESGQHTWIKL
jgi:hypothetical protein